MFIGPSLALGTAVSPQGASIVRSLFDRAGVAIAGRDGSVVQSGATGASWLCPATGAVQTAGSTCQYNLVLNGVGILPMFFAQGARTNLFLNSNAPATQNVTVGTGSVTVSAVGSGYTLTTSAGTATGSGFGAVTMGGSQVLTITGAGTITLTVAGTPSGGYVNVEQAAFAGIKLITAGTSVTRTADNLLWTPPSALSTTAGEVVAVAAPYLWSAGAGVAHPSGASARKWGSGNNYDIRGAGVEGVGREDLAAQTATLGSLADASAALRMTSNNWGASALTYYRGAASAATDVSLSAPWTSVASLSVGSSSTVAHWFGFVGLIYIPNGLTAAERQALANLTSGTLTYLG